MKTKFKIFEIIIAAWATLSIPDLASSASVLVNKTQDTSDGICDAQDCSLREAMFAAASGDIVEFSELFNAPQTITLSGSNLVFSSDITLKGPGSDLLTISGNQISRVFLIPASHNVSISDLSIRNGSSFNAGGGIQVEGTLSLQNAIIANNRVFAENNPAGRNGGGINCVGSLNAKNIIVSDNQALNKGAGIYIRSPTVGFISNSSITNNFGADRGGGIFIDGSSLTTVGSTIGNNSTLNFGGGIYVSGGALILNESTIVGNMTNNESTAAGVDNFFGRLEILNSTFSGNNIANNNLSFQSAGALWTSGPTTITNSTFTENFAPTGTANASGIYHSAGTLIIRALSLLGIRTLAALMT